MTVAQLKRHMDWRFDHLDRTMVDKSDLSRFATKDDFKRFATKDDLKVELKGYATRDEMQHQFAAVFRRLDSLNDKIDEVLSVVQHNRDVFDRVVDEHDRHISELELRGNGQQRLFPDA